MTDLNTKAVVDGVNVVVSSELKGKKLSFAERISNLSPEETPFISSIPTEAIKQTLHQWQTDALETAECYDGKTKLGPQAGDNPSSFLEGSDAVYTARRTTEIVNNNTQIFRKALAVTDTANAIRNYGRAEELLYQMDKAGKELKRDMEVTFLRSQRGRSGTAASTATGGYMAGFQGNCAYKAITAADGSDMPFSKSSIDEALVTADNLKRGAEAVGVTDADTSACTVRCLSEKIGEWTKDKDWSGLSATPEEKDIFDMTYNLYLSGSEADTIMFHPKWAPTFAAMQTKAGVREKVFKDGDTTFTMQVSEITDPLGRKYKLVPNRWMPEEAIYFYRATDWTKLVLREVDRKELAKVGSSEKWMLETEVSLKHKHPFASGVLYTFGSHLPSNP